MKLRHILAVSLLLSLWISITCAATCDAVCADDSGAVHPCRGVSCGTCGETGCICPDGLPPEKP